MTKIISISDKAYNRLKKIKKNDSFTGTILKLTEPSRKKSLLEIVKTWKPNDKLAKNIEEAYRKRKDFRFKRTVI